MNNNDYISSAEFQASCKTLKLEIIKLPDKNFILVYNRKNDCHCQIYSKGNIKVKTIEDILKKLEY